MGNNSDKVFNLKGVVLVLTLFVIITPYHLSNPINVDLTNPFSTQFTQQTFVFSGINLDQTNFVTTNFDLSFFLPSGSRRDESYGLYIKQALAPLGIDVKIFAKPWGQFVGELTYQSSTGKEWDMATTGFNREYPTPDLSWLYHSEGFWGSNIMQLGDGDFQAWQLGEVGLNQTTDIDPLIELIDYELNLTKRYELMYEFNDLYFTKLLWNVPLISQIVRVAMWKGFGGVSNDLWDPQEGIIFSSFLGAHWDSAHIASQRLSNSSTIRWAVNDQFKFNLDPFQSLDDQQGSQTDWSYMGEFLTFDKTNSPHPNVAWNWFSGDFGDTWDSDDNDSTLEVPLTQYTFLLRDDVYWHETLDFEGNVVPGERVDGLDYNLTLTMFDMARQSNNFEIMDKDSWKVLADWDISTTIFPNDTVTIRVPNSFRTPDDLFKFGKLNPLPEHLLGDDLIFYNSTSGLNETAQLAPGMLFDPWDTFQWNSFESLEGNTAVGPYRMVDYDYNVYHSFAARPDYWYPNEWDVTAFHNNYNAELVPMETNYGIDLGLWGGLSSYSQDAFYHSWNETNPDFHDKPTALTIEFIEYVVIDDQNAELIKFESGDLDFFESSQQGASTLSAHLSNSDLIVKDTVPNESARLLFFNLLNDHLKKINVRLAISHVIDDSKLVSIHDGFGIPWWSVADANKQSGGIDWGTIQHPLAYDYARARDLMRLEGYNAADTNDFIPSGGFPDWDIPKPTYPDLEDTRIFIDYWDFFGISIGILVIYALFKEGKKKIS